MGQKYKISRKKQDQIKARVLKRIKTEMKIPRDWGGDFGTTKGRSGETVEGSYRDIYDLGDLTETLKLKWKGNDLVLESNSSYANPVFKGYYTSTGKYIPPREPWRDINLRGLR